MVINIHASGIDMTDAIHTYAQEKMESLKKYHGEIIQIDLSAGMTTQHHNQGKIYFAEAVIFVPKQKIVVKKEAEDMYKAIDKVRDHLKVEFEKIKGKLRGRDRELIREQKAYHDEEEAFDMAEEDSLELA
jgi:ribosomal subunit interface protein